ncbi:ATP-dependent RNA helicase DDX54 [Petaurus breviceps papuanus]|uniref:ATP-dependent RNA helicase DDX54 n=1 Tax=Petaurus breviceps papuanus TaxID=3040969 RepID=UPI0036DF92C8
MAPDGVRRGRELGTPPLRREGPWGARLRRYRLPRLLVRPGVERPPPAHACACRRGLVALPRARSRPTSAMITAKAKGSRSGRGHGSHRGPRQARGGDMSDGDFEIQLEGGGDAPAQKLGPSKPLPTFPALEAASDVEPDTQEMVRAQNKKKKKSGGFQSMGLSYPVFKGIMKKGYKVPTPIQRKTIPVILDGKDVVAMARTGSGKTACFLIPMFEKLKAHSAQTGARALILSPTRELALQTMKFTKELGKFTGLKTALILGGDKMEDQFAALHENPDIIIATPGRLMHVAVEMNLKLQSVQYAVFDEADRLFEMGFAEQLQDIIGRLPEDHQTVLFSATLPKLLVEFARAGLTEPVLIRLDVDTKLNEQLKMAFFHIREDDKPAMLLHLLRNVVRPQDQTVVFVATKHQAEYLKELLTIQGVCCTHIYSSLDQTARKINLAKFVHSKCSALIVTDVAARGLDIPLLDNVINYNFPAKSKLFLHRVGRVARAGRSGTAYSLVAPDEVPYVFDLHLFLGRPLTLAIPDEKPSDACLDGVLGRVPRSVVDDEECRLITDHDVSSELQSLRRVAGNAHKQYLRSRPGPSPESIKRAKDLDPTLLGLHPLFSSQFEDKELERMKLVDSIKNYRSRATIFEINTTTRDPGSQVMRAKRKRDHKAIAKFQQGQQARQQAQPGPPPSTQKSQEPEEEEEEVEEAFTEVLGRKRRRPEAPGQKRGKETARHRPEAPGQKRGKETAGHRDEDFYIPYRPKDFDSERGLSIGGEGSAFEQQVSSAVLDLMGDESHNLTKGRQLLKWDRKKKRFVGNTGQEDKKKIKTESGRYISSSYKRDLYQKWKQKHKIGDRDSEEEEGEGEGKRRGWNHGRGRGRGASAGQTSGAGGTSGAHGRVRSELKNKQQILKQRRRAEKQRFLQRGGLKQLSARNRRRAQELRQSAFGRRPGSNRKGKMRKKM